MQACNFSIPKSLLMFHPPFSTGVRLGLLIVFSLMLFGCSEITSTDLETRNGVAFQKGSRTPYTGPVRQYYKNPDGSNGKLFMEGMYADGRKTNVWTYYKWNGEQSIINYVNGVKEGIAKDFFANGKPMREQRFFDGKPNGQDVQFDIHGARVKQDFYRHGVLGSPPTDRKAEIREEEEEKVLAEERNERLFGKRKKSWFDHLTEMF